MNKPGNALFYYDVESGQVLNQPSTQQDYRILHDAEGFHCQHRQLGRWWHGTHPTQNAYSIFPSLGQATRYFESYGHTDYEFACQVDGCTTCLKAAWMQLQAVPSYMSRDLSAE